ncbi:MAG: hypothetical protein Q8N84_01720 [bacterium]|nr:hypothetical protein [bacterium]
MANGKQKGKDFLLSYSPEISPGVTGGLLVILIGTIIAYKYWYIFTFNILMIGNYLFKELRLATVFYAVILRIIMTPIAKVLEHYESLAEGAEAKYKELTSNTNNPLMLAQVAKDWFRVNKKTVLWNFFNICFYCMHAVAIGFIFLHPFSKERVDALLKIPSIYPPHLPLNTQCWIPLIGQVDLAQYSPELNLTSAIGAAIVGLFQVVLNKKTDRKEMMMYLIGFPTGAYLITRVVPSGFEFALTVFELLSIMLTGFQWAVRKAGGGQPKKAVAWKSRKY